jgi:hypothetical protein
VLIEVGESDAAVCGSSEGVVGLDAGALAVREGSKSAGLNRRKERRDELLKTENSSNASVVVLLVRDLEICSRRKVSTSTSRSAANDDESLENDDERISSTHRRKCLEKLAETR